MSEQRQESTLALELKSRWWLYSLGLLASAVAFILLLSRDGPKSNPPRVVVLATWYTNGEQLVMFRPDPPSAEITYIYLVSGSDDGKNPPPTVRSFGHVVALRNERETNSTLHLVAFPTPGAFNMGRPLTYTPGSYTVAYTPSERVHRVAFGVAHEENVIGDLVRRLRNSWKQKTLTTLKMKSYQDPVFITSEPITNSAPRTR